MLAGDSLEDVAAKAAKLDGVIFRSLLEGGDDGKSVRSFSEMLGALSKDKKSAEAWVKATQAKFDEISDGVTLKAADYIEKDLKPLIKESANYTNFVRTERARFEQETEGLKATRRSGSTTSCFHGRVPRCSCDRHRCQLC